MTRGRERDEELRTADGHVWYVSGGGVVCRDSVRVSAAELRALDPRSAVARWLVRLGAMPKPSRHGDSVLVGVRLSPPVVAKLAALRVALGGVSPSVAVEVALMEYRLPTAIERKRSRARRAKGRRTR